jgi:phytoene synthase
VDEGQNKARAVIELQERLALVYAGQPRNAPEDRAFASVVEDFDMPAALPEALLEGLAWDAMEHRYASLSDLRSYCARVASAVGAMMCVLMRVRDADALARACDLGVAMQLTNIARDVGEDARAGRIYLPLDWIHAEGLDPQSVLSATQASPELRRMVKQLLSEAQALYARSEVGVAALPLNARTGIYAARYIYAAIGQAVTRNHYDSITHRGRTNRAQKMALLAKSSLRTTASLVMPKSPVLYARPLPEVQFLVDAVAVNQRHAMSWGQGHTGAFMAAMAELKRKDHAQASGVMLAK